MEFNKIRAYQGGSGTESPVDIADISTTAKYPPTGGEMEIDSMQKLTQRVLEEARQFQEQMGREKLRTEKLYTGLFSDSIEEAEELLQNNKQNVKVDDMSNRVNWLNLIAIIGSVATLLGFFWSAMSSKIDDSIKISESIREQIAAENRATLIEIKAGNSEVRRLVQDSSKETDHKLEMLKMSIENKTLQDKLEEK